MTRLDAALLVRALRVARGALLFATGTSLTQYRRGVFCGPIATGRTKKRPSGEQYFANGMPPACWHCSPETGVGKPS
jgi:hypothetical protein